MLPRRGVLLVAALSLLTVGCGSGASETGPVPAVPSGVSSSELSGSGAASLPAAESPAASPGVVDSEDPTVDPSVGPSGVPVSVEVAELPPVPGIVVGPPLGVGAEPSQWDPVNLSVDPPPNVFLALRDQRLVWEGPPSGLPSVFAVSSDESVVRVVPQASGLPELVAVAPGRAQVDLWGSETDVAFMGPAKSYQIAVVGRPVLGTVTAAPVNVSGMTSLDVAVMVPQQLALWAEPLDTNSPVSAWVGNAAVAEPVSVLTGEGSTRVPGVRALGPGVSSVVFWVGEPGALESSVLLELLIVVR